MTRKKYGFALIFVLTVVAFYIWRTIPNEHSIVKSPHSANLQSDGSNVLIPSTSGNTDEDILIGKGPTARKNAVVDGIDTDAETLVDSGSEDEAPINSDSSINQSRFTTISSSVKGQRLVWSPPEIIESNRLFDLCLDEDAIDSGLDGGDLDTERVNLGIDCSSGSNENRFATVSNGELIFSDDSSVSLAGNDADSEGSDRVQSSSDILLGYSGPDFDIALVPEGELGGVVVLTDSLNTQDDITYGLISNTSNSLATDVTVTVGGNTVTYPISLQPGETAAFAAEGADATEAEVQSTLSNSLDLSRAIVVTGTPGYWSGPAGQIPSLIPLSDLPADLLEGVVYYETQLKLRLPEEHLARINPETFAIENVKVLVSFLDEQQMVVGQFSPQTMSAQGVDQQESSRISVDESLVLGFLLPAEADNFTISVGGDPLL